MALAHSSSIATDGLIFAYDMTNTQNSWKGRPVTNIFALPTVDVNGFSVQNNTFTRVRSGNYGGYEITGNDYVWRFDFTSSVTCPYHGNDTTVSVGVTYTFSFDYYVSPDAPAGGYGTRNLQLANFEQAISASVSDTTPTVVGVWKRAVFTGTTSSTNLRALLYPGSCNVSGGMSSSGYILFKNPQVEASAPGNNPSPFVDGTRSNTQAIRDLTSQSTVTTGSLTYNFDNTFDFNYASPGYISVPLATAFNKIEGTINLWLYPTRYNGGNGYFVNREDSTPNAVDWFWIGPYSDTFYFRIGNGSDCCSNDLSFGSVSTVIPLNTWTNMCFTWKINGNSVIYKNGEQFASRAIGNIPNTNPASNGRFGLGHDNADNYYNGKMPVAQIYNRQLTALEVRQNFQAMRGRYGI